MVFFRIPAEFTRRRAPETHPRHPKNVGKFLESKKRWKFEQEHQRHEQQEHQHHDQAEEEVQEDSQEICRFLMSFEEVRICSTIRRNAML